MPEPVKKPEEEKTSEIVETADGGVEVSIEQETPETVQEIEKKPEPKPEDSLRNKVYAQDRIISKQQREIELLKSARPVEKEPEPIVELDELDKIAQKDWKLAVRKLAAEEARNVVQSEKQRLDLARTQETVSVRQEQNSQAVLARHPELFDNASEKSQIFQSILDKNPEWRTSPDGPLLVMYQMEDELRKSGVETDEPGRLKRVTSISLPVSKIVPSNNKIVLTREQKEFCDQNGVSYEDYARTLKKSGDRMGVEI